jgi:hypothetical protein
MGETACETLRNQQEVEEHVEVGDEASPEPSEPKERCSPRTDEAFCQLKLQYAQLRKLCDELCDQLERTQQLDSSPPELVCDAPHQKLQISDRGKHTAEATAVLSSVAFEAEITELRAQLTEAQASRDRLHEHARQTEAESAALKQALAAAHSGLEEWKRCALRWESELVTQAAELERMREQLRAARYPA